MAYMGDGEMVSRNVVMMDAGTNLLDGSLNVSYSLHSHCHLHPCLLILHTAAQEAYTAE
jgi:hypothetical protein